MTPLAALLHETIERELPYLRAAPPEICNAAPGNTSAWSPKEELGHLIDSAANNHQRFVRAALDGQYEGPGYAQDAWVALHGYRNIPWEKLVSFWFAYNTLLTTLIDNIPAECLEASCSIGGNDPVSLAFLIEDYVKHMRHHLDHLLRRETVTKYP